MKVQRLICVLLLIACTSSFLIFQERKNILVQDDYLRQQEVKKYYQESKLILTDNSDQTSQEGLQNMLTRILTQTQQSDLDQKSQNPQYENSTLEQSNTTESQSNQISYDFLSTNSSSSSDNSNTNSSTNMYPPGIVVGLAAFIGGIYGVCKQWCGNSGCSIVINLILGALIGAMVFPLLVFLCYELCKRRQRVVPQDSHSQQNL